MKKIIALVLSIAVVCSLFGVLSFAAEPTTTLYTSENGGIIWDASFWLSNDTSHEGTTHTLRTESIMFKTDKAIYSVGLTTFWSSNPASAGQVKATITFKLYKFSYNVENSLKATPVAEGSFTSNGDNNSGAAFEEVGTNCTISNNSGNSGIKLTFTEVLEAGQYIFVISETAQSNVDSETHYLVVPSTQEEGDATKFQYAFNGEVKTDYTSRIEVVVADGGQFVTLDAETEAPTDAPQTGDMTVAMFAVVAILALAAVVVLKKRVNA